MRLRHLMIERRHVLLRMLLLELLLELLLMLWMHRLRLVHSLLR
jgi:hypothetical protein